MAHHLTSTVWELMDYAIYTYKPGGVWDIADDILENGWLESEAIDMVVQPGGVTYLKDGNHRVKFLAANGHFDVVVPLNIIIGTLKGRGERPQKT